MYKYHEDIVTQAELINQFKLILKLRVLKFRRKRMYTFVIVDEFTKNYQVIENQEFGGLNKMF